MSIFAEETDIWPFRRQFIEINQITQWKLDVRCNGDAVDHQPVEFDAHLPGHGVRIPVLMLHRPYQLTNQTDSVQPAIENSFTQRLRSEVKQHIWVNPHPDYQELETVELYWGYRTQTPQERANRVPPTRQMNFTGVANLDVVYPVFKPGCNAPELVYGICFCHRIPANVYTRTYMRFVHEDNNSGKAFDITQDFFSENANPNDPLMRHYRNQTLFHNSRTLDRRNSIAFYVCRGARLIVSDGRSPSPMDISDRYTKLVLWSCALALEVFLCAVINRMVAQYPLNGKLCSTNQLCSALKYYCPVKERTEHLMIGR